MPKPNEDPKPEELTSANEPPHVQAQQPGPFQPFVAYKTVGEVRPSSFPLPVWWAVLGAICLFEFILGFFLLKNGTRVMPSFCIGLGISATLVAVFDICLAKKGRLGWNIGASFAILVALYVGSVPGYMARKIKENVEQGTMGRSIAKDLRGLVDAGPTGKLKRLDTSAKASGKWGEIELCVKKMTNEMIEVRNGYLEDLDAIKWDTILDANRLAGDKKFLQTHKMLKEAKDAVKSRKLQAIDVMKRATVEVRQIETDDKDKREFIKGFTSGTDKSLLVINKVWNLELKTIEEFEAIIALLEKNRDGWEPSEGQVAFYNDAYLNAYNAHMAKVEEYSKRQEEIQKERVGKVRKGIALLGN